MKKTILENGTTILEPEFGWIVNEDNSICTNYQVWLAKNDSEDNYHEISNEEKEEIDKQNNLAEISQPIEIKNEIL